MSLRFRVPLVVAASFRIAAACLDSGPLGAAESDAPGLVSQEFVFEQAPFASCHASTLVETPAGLVAAWFGGTAEGRPDVGIWTARKVDGRWTEPVEVCHGVQPDGTRFPCWNPVLFRPAATNASGTSAPLLLFWKVGPSPSKWWGMVRTSPDDGRTWNEPRRLPDGILGPVKNKPVQLADGTIVSGSSREGLSPRPTWRIHFERSTDGGATWSVAEVPTTADSPDAIQPSVLLLGGDRLAAVGRTRSGRVFATESKDAGRTWSAPDLLALPNPNAGTDAVTLRDGRHLLVYNHTSKGRSPLNVAVSRDARTWQAALVLERDPGEYSYPAVIQTGDGLVHATWTWKRQRVKHVVLDPAKLVAREMPDGRWPE